MLILISDAFDASLPGKLAKYGEVTEDHGRLREAHVVLVRSKTKCNKEYIDQAPNLKLIIRGGVGTDNIDKAYAATKGIMVRNTPRASSIAVAELAFAMMLAASSRLVEAHNSMKEGKFLKKELTRTELFGKTLCLLGMGNIATEVAIRARAFGMKVKAWRKSGRQSPYADVKPTLAEALRDADYVSIHLPLTEETSGLINASTIELMKTGAVLVNTGRGKCIVPQDVAAALASGKLGCYATDVWPSDPPPADYPILKAPNVLMTPHLGASTKENLLRIGEEIDQMIGELIKEGKL